MEIRRATLADAPILTRVSRNARLEGYRGAIPVDVLEWLVTQRCKASSGGGASAVDCEAMRSKGPGKQPLHHDEGCDEVDEQGESILGDG